MNEWVVRNCDEDCFKSVIAYLYKRSKRSNPFEEFNFEVQYKNVSLYFKRGYQGGIIEPYETHNKLIDDKHRKVCDMFIYNTIEVTLLDGYEKIKTNRLSNSLC